MEVAYDLCELVTSTRRAVFSSIPELWRERPLQAPSYEGGFESGEGKSEHDDSCLDLQDDIRRKTRWM